MSNGYSNTEGATYIPCEVQPEPICYGYAAAMHLMGDERSDEELLAAEHERNTTREFNRIVELTPGDIPRIMRVMADSPTEIVNVDSFLDGGEVEYHWSEAPNVIYGESAPKREAK